MDCPVEHSTPFTVDNAARRWTSKDIRRRCRRQGQLITFDMLPNDVLLEIFDFYAEEGVGDKVKQSIEVWVRLAHVCRRWRSIVFQSPLRLNLRLVCTPKTPTRDIMDIWPPFPLVICSFDDYYSVRPSIEDNIISALEYNDRVCQIQLTRPDLSYFTNSVAILKPFPELTVLRLNNLYLKEHEGREPILPDSFLHGSAPRLESLHLDGVSFPGLPKLLLSATNLIYLYLTSVPRSGYIPPEAIATGLSALTSLEYLWFCFIYPPPRSTPTRRPPPPPLTRSILPSLTKIEFRGASEYLEVILARIETPRLHKLDIIFFNQIVFDTPQLFQFISRSPTLRFQEKVDIEFHPALVIIKFRRSWKYDQNLFDIRILSKASDWQLSSLGQICTSHLPPVSTLEDFYLSESKYPYHRPHWQGDIENMLWLDLLRPFVALKNLYISEEIVPRIAPAFQELVREGTAETFLPSLVNIFLKDYQPLTHLHEGIKDFVVARWITTHPVAVCRWGSPGVHDIGTIGYFRSVRDS